MEILEGKAWISYQMLFQKGGYAYIAIGNNVDSHYSISLHFSQRYIWISTVISQVCTTR
jgi:hypothetical protein